MKNWTIQEIESLTESDMLLGAKGLDSIELLDDGVCNECGHPLDDDEPVCVIDEGMRTERVVCETCCGSLCGNGKVIQCENCGAYFASGSLHDEEINEYSFTECPACHKDVVDCQTREEFEADHFPYRYAVIVRDFQGRQRAYVVSVFHPNISNVIKKLVGRVDLDGIANISVAEIILEEDEF